GIVCPFPGTPFHQQLAREGRLLPGTISRDYDGYTLCHRPSRLDVSEVVEHYRQLSRSLSSLSSIAHHYWSKLWSSSMPRYRRSTLISAREIFSVRNPCDNRRRTFIGGRDPVEAWDARMMRELGLQPQLLS